MENDPLNIKSEHLENFSEPSKINKVLICPNCNEIFRRQAVLDSHRKSCDNCLKFISDGKCTICGWNNGTQSVFLHLRKEHPFRIQFAQELPKQAKKVKKAKKSSKPQKSNTVKKAKEAKGAKKQPKILKNCEFCGKKFGSKSWRKEHLKLCEKYYRYLNDNKCGICGRKVKTLPGFFTHVKSVHETSEPKTQNNSSSESEETAVESFKCVQCDITFQDQISFLAHLRVLHQQKAKSGKVIINRLADIPCSICRCLIKEQDYDQHRETCGKPKKVEPIEPKISSNVEPLEAMETFEDIAVKSIAL